MQFGNPALYIAIFFAIIVAVVSVTRGILKNVSRRKARREELTTEVRRILQVQSYSNNQEWIDVGGGWREQVFHVIRDPRYNALQSLFWVILRVSPSEIRIVLTYPKIEAIPTGMHDRVHNTVAEFIRIFQEMGLTSEIRIFDGPHLIVMPAPAA